MSQPAIVGLINLVSAVSNTSFAFMHITRHQLRATGRESSALLELILSSMQILTKPVVLGDRSF